MDGHDHTAEFQDCVATKKGQARRRVWIVYETRPFVGVHEREQAVEHQLHPA